MKYELCPKCNKKGLYYEVPGKNKWATCKYCKKSWIVERWDRKLLKMVKVNFTPERSPDV